MFVKCNHYCRILESRYNDPERQMCLLEWWVYYSNRYENKCSSLWKWVVWKFKRCRIRASHKCSRQCLMMCQI